jgi:glycosyltransferase involved in cell wall biosynthesis
MTTGPDRLRIALAHDYLSTIGGAERVVLSMIRAFPGAPLYTSLFEPELVDPEFRTGVDIETSSLNRFRALRRNYRIALPVMAPAISRMHVDADVLLVSSSGWAHGISNTGKKVVYCHNPPRWVYQRREYAPLSKPLWWATALGLHPYLHRWDRRAERSCDRYIANSSIVARRIETFYGRSAEILPPPSAFDPGGPRQAIAGLDGGFYLTVGRLIGHKNTRALVEAFSSLPDHRLVVAGDGPERASLEASAPANVRLVGRVSDAELRWLYANSAGLVSASPEDFGLTPIEAAAFGTPSVLLRFGGFMDTMVEDETATFFAAPRPEAIADAVRRAARQSWDTHAIEQNALRFSADRFESRLLEIVREEMP